MFYVGRHFYNMLRPQKMVIDALDGCDDGFGAIYYGDTMYWNTRIFAILSKVLETPQKGIGA